GEAAPAQTYTLSLHDALPIYGIADVEVVQTARETRDAVDGRSVDGEDDVAGDDAPVIAHARALQSCRCCSRTARDLENHHAFDTHAARDQLIKPVIHLDAQRRSDVASRRNQLRDDAVDRVDGDGEADAGPCAGRAVDRRVDADQSPRAVEQRTTRVALVDRGIRLDQMRDQVASIAGRQRTIERRDDAGRQRPVE